MSATVAAGALLIALPIAFNVAFAGLAMKFDYPDVLRRPTDDVLQLFRAGGTPLVLLWWAFGITAVMFAPLAVLVAAVLGEASPTIVTLGVVLGVLAALVQFLGLMRWPFMVPYLARVATDPETSVARKEAVEIVFQSTNRYLGVAIGEHLGYLFTGAWSALVGVALIQSNVAPAWLGIIGIAVGVVLAICALEFVGPFEPSGWRLAGAVIPIAYIVWSVWLVATGIAVLL